MILESAADSTSELAGSDAPSGDGRLGAGPVEPPSRAFAAHHSGHAEAVQSFLNNPSEGRWAQVFKLAELGVMSSSLLHELRQPLFALKGFLQMVLHERQDDADLRLRRCLRLVEEIEGIAGGFLDFSRAAADQWVPVDLRAPIDGAISLLQGRIRKARISLDVEVSGDLPVVIGNPLTLQQVVVNLVSNAIDALVERQDEQPRRLWIQARRSADDAQVYVYIADNGAGIAPENAARIFDYFFTTKPEGKGTGLGLAISMGIMWAHGGEIQLVSADELKGGGDGSPRTVFRIVLPNSTSR